MIRTKRIYIWFLPLCLGLCFSCKKADGGDEPQPQAEAYGGVIEARASVDRLYERGLLGLYRSVDPEEGLPLAWGAYLSGLIESESEKGYYLALVQGDYTQAALRILSERIYSSCLVAIEQANQVLTNLERSPSLEQELREQLRGETLLLRGLNRFYLLRSFGSLVEDRSRASSLGLKEAYTMIEEDLKEAITLLPETSWLENDRRPTAFLGRAILAEAYLAMSGYPLLEDRFSEAIATLRPIVQSRKHSLELSLGAGQPSAFAQLRLNPESREYLYALSGGAMGDREQFSLPREAKSWPKVSMPVAFNAFRPTELFMSLYPEGDVRGRDQEYFHSFYKVQEGERTIFQVFQPAPYFWVGTRGQKAVGFYRYAEVLLMLAEAIAQQEGVTSEAVALLATIRSRAWLGEPRDFVAELSSLDLSAFLEELWLERLRELPFEMKQLFDIIRTHRYPEQAAERVRLRPLEESFTPRGRAWGAESLQLPLP